MAVRDATPPDFAAVERLLAANRLPTAGVPLSLRNFLVAEDGGAIIGAIGLELFGDTALLRSAVVEESARGTGIGSRLVEGALARAAELRVRELYLLTTSAEKYFPRFGFTLIPRDAAPAAMTSSAEFTGACPASAVLMKLALGAARRD